MNRLMSPCSLRAKNSTIIPRHFGTVWIVPIVQIVWSSFHYAWFLYNRPNRPSPLQIGSGDQSDFMETLALKTLRTILKIGIITIARIASSSIRMIGKFVLLVLKNTRYSKTVISNSCLWSGRYNKERA